MALNRHFPGYFARFVYRFSAISRESYRLARMILGLLGGTAADACRRGGQQPALAFGVG